MQGNQRPSSRASSVQRPPSSLSLSRAPSALSFNSQSTTTQQPPTLQPKTPKPSAARYGGLAEKEIQKITSSIRGATSTRRTLRERQISGDLHAVNESSSFRAEPAPPGSFLAESSFTRAPLNSRLPPISPHRAVNQAAASKGKQRRAAEDSFEEGDLTYLSDEGSGEDEEEEEEREEDRIARLAKERVDRVERIRIGLEKESLRGLDEKLQEAIIVEDLLFVLMGIEGHYIEFDESYSPEDDFERLQGAKFVVDSELEPWLASSVQRFLPIATHYTAIHSFVEQYSLLELGAINHALCAALREILKDYQILLSQLEHQFLTSTTFTLQTLWSELCRTLHTLSLLHNLTTTLISLDMLNENSEDEDDDEEGDDSSVESNENLRGILDEMKSATKMAKAKEGDGWRGGPAKGGEVLYVLSVTLEKNFGDPIGRNLYSLLLLKASQPYAEILVKWITMGLLRDPFEEFLIKETKSITMGGLDLDYTDEYWERRFALRDKISGGRRDISGEKRQTKKSEAPRERGLSGGAVIPSFLEKWKWKILLAGKYLNVIRECGIEVKLGETTSGVEEMGALVAINEEPFYKRIDDAYSFANKTLLKLLLQEQHLVSRLKSIKQYFFIDHGDAFGHFLDLAKYELSKKKKHASMTKLQSLLDFCLRNPSAASSQDPFKEDLKVELGSETLTNWLVDINKVDGNFGGGDGDGFDRVDGFGSGKAKSREELEKEKEKAANSLFAHEAFMLDYTVKFPLSLVISRKTILRYQLIFRHLLQLKQLERTLTDTWLEHTKSPVWRNRSSSPELEQWKGRVYVLRARMLAFVQQMYSFAVGEVLEPNWRMLESKLQKVETVDQLLRDHVDFLDTCLKECLLTNEKLLVLHNKLLTVCTLFASYTNKFGEHIRVATAAARKLGGDWSTVDLTESWKLLDKFEKNFNHHSKANLERIGFHAGRENAALLPLHIRLTALKLPE